ncbi:site-specific integrase [Kineococcus rhizosphaerae]|uniref:Site-specific recombinase XerD n=1 Tax=Kineococcus rhizosphaerae TaxID=559628 RepID=A0A2T0RAH5_9ACTN|nr:site-specific integrase [Kineococcus rhizosphaerae]PRY18172.1 site-specific recombinase XerD [Kineococcus rhizosphaerae]
MSATGPDEVPAELAAALLPPLDPPPVFDADTLSTWFASLDPVRRGVRAPGTWRAYAVDLAHFAEWCALHDLQPLPAAAETVADYLVAHVEKLSVATLQRRLAAIAVAHGVIGVPSPTDGEHVGLVWRGLRRVHEPGRRRRRVDALETRNLADLVAPLTDTVMDHRDRALLVLGFAGALRRSELSALEVGDVVVEPGRLLLTVRAAGARAERVVELPRGKRLETCPVRSWRKWAEVARLAEGPAFRRMTKGGKSLRPERLGDRGVAEVVKRRTLDVGLDPSLFSGHSLRAGFVTSAARAGVPGVSIARQTGHRSAAALAACVREERPFPGNPAAHVGL